MSDDTDEEKREHSARYFRVRRRVQRSGLKMYADRLFGTYSIFQPPGADGEVEGRALPGADSYRLVVWGTEHRIGLTLEEAEDVFKGKLTPIGWTAVIPDNDEDVLRRPAKYVSTGPVTVVL